MALTKGAPPNLRTELRFKVIRILTQTLSDHVAFEQALEDQCRNDSQQDRAWCLDVAAGVLRWKGRLDLAIDSLAERKKPTGWLRKALWLGGYQLWQQDRVPHALVVSETVELIKVKEGVAPSRFANALLRRLSEAKDDWIELDIAGIKNLRDQAQAAGFSEWYWKKLVTTRGEAWAIAFAKACLERPSVWISAQSEAWKPSLPAEAGPIPRSWKLLEGGTIPTIQGFEQGEFIVQDISSQRLVQDVVELARERFGNQIEALDLCAAPGGKTVGLAWRGVRVTASDRGQIRLSLLRETLNRTAREVEVLDAAAVRASEKKYDLVWVDAPCSSSGVVRRHPDVRWAKIEKDLETLRPTQLELVRTGWEKVRPGGILVYSVCSVFPEEGPMRIQESGIAAEKLLEASLFPQESPGGDGFLMGAYLKI